MAANSEFAGEVERLYKAEEVMLEQHESLLTQLKQRDTKLSRQSQVVTNNEEKSDLQRQIQQLKLSLENANSENDKLKGEGKKLLESNKSSRQQVTLIEWIRGDGELIDLFVEEEDMVRLETDLQQERRLREAGDQQMEMLKSELRKAEDSLATMIKKQVDTETVDKMRKMKNQNESLGAENFEYAVENVGYCSLFPDCHLGILVLSTLSIKLAILSDLVLARESKQVSCYC